MEALQGYAIIILAAGNSSRLGEPKQLLKFQKKTLIRHITEAAIEAKSVDVFVVTGSNADLMEQELHSLSYRSVHNHHWESGMASSIVAGVRELLAMFPNVAGAIFAVSDQPFVNASLLNTLIQKSLDTNSGIVSCSYDDTLGTPVLFSKKYFPSLLSLTGTEGAKKLLAKFARDVITIPFPQGGIDIDTQEDYRNLLSQ
jgi:molybdenum cofactor cytidylyltransferase